MPRVKSRNPTCSCWHPTKSKPLLGGYTPLWWFVDKVGMTLKGKWRQLRVLIYLHLGYVSCPPYSALPPGLGKGLLPLQIDAPVGEERSWEEGEGWVKSWTQSNTSHHWAQSVLFQSLGWNFQRFLPLIRERTRAPGARLLPQSSQGSPPLF